MTKFGWQESKPTTTPIRTSDKITKNLDGVEVDSIYYQSIIGSLFYLIASQLDISFSVGACARYQASLKESHLRVVKRIIRYVHGTLEFWLWYPFDTTCEIARYSNIDWTSYVEDCKSMNGCCFYIGNNLVSWHSKKQNSISLSTVEAKYIATGNRCTQLLWMK